MSTQSTIKNELIHYCDIVYINYVPNKKQNF